MNYYASRKGELIPPGRVRKPKYTARWVQEVAAARAYARRLNEARKAALDRLERAWCA